ncbi:MAG: hypothetical protein U1G07_09655 [Verrucomicrobiota bacterium]
MHLLTREAFEIYQRHLRPSGLIAVHLSNLYLDLAGPVAQLAQASALESVVIEHQPALEAQLRGLASSTWLLAATTLPKTLLLSAESRFRPASKRCGPVWTDERANIFDAWK